MVNKEFCFKLFMLQCKHLKIVGCFPCLTSVLTTKLLFGSALKGILIPKITIIYSFTHPNVIPNHYKMPFVEHRKRYFGKCVFVCPYTYMDTSYSKLKVLFGIYGCMENIYGSFSLHNSGKINYNIKMFFTRRKKMLY